MTDNANLDLRGPQELLDIWNAHGDYKRWTRILGDAEADGEAVHLAAVAAEWLAAHEPVTALAALAANAELVRLLTGWRWSAMKDAREHGATWEQVGEALGTTKQGAQVAYRRAIEAQEKYAGDFHNGEAARAVL